MARNVPTLIQLAIFFQFLVDLFVFLNLSPIREILGFIYLTFIPGILVLKALKLDKRDNLENLLLSVGLSIALLMFSGLFIDILLPIAGIASPLSTLPLLIVINVITLLACASICLRHLNIPMSNLNLPRYSIPLIAVPFLSLIGVLVANTYGVNLLLLLMLLAVAGLISFGVFYSKSLPRGFYPVAIIAISIALLFHSSLTTNYIVGWDIHSEYHVFRSTDNIAFWNASYVSIDDGINKGNAMLSVTILPTIYSKITNIDPTFILKILYPLVLAFVPLILYKLYSSRMKKRDAFLAVAFLVSNSAFFATEGFPAKQMIGELFLVLLVLVILDTEIGTCRKSFLFVVFGAGLVVSHYSLSYLFLFFIFLVWLASSGARLIRRSTWRAPRITFSMILTLSVIAFGWYVYSSNYSPFNSIVGVGEHVSRTFLSDFFSLSARTSIIMTGVGAGVQTSLEHQMGRIVFYAAEFFIAIGILKMLYKKEQASFGYEYTALSVLSLVMLFVCLVVPNFAAAFRAERFYEISLLFLAPFFVLGGEAFLSSILKRKRQMISLSLVLLVLIFFLLFETGFIYEVTRDNSYSVPLSRYRMDPYQLFKQITDESQVTTAYWLSSNANLSNSSVYGDFISTSHVLTSYGMIPAEVLVTLTNMTHFGREVTYVYLREPNTVEFAMTTNSLTSWNMSDIQPILMEQDVLYSNEGCIIVGGP